MYYFYLPSKEIVYLCGVKTQTKIQIKNLKAMKKVKLRAFWESLSVTPRNKILLEVADKCHNSIQTVRAWMLEYRKPQGLYRDALAEYLKENFQVEIIEEGGEK